MLLTLYLDGLFGQHIQMNADLLFYLLYFIYYTYDTVFKFLKLEFTILKLAFYHMELIFVSG